MSSTAVCRCVYHSSNKCISLQVSSESQMHQLNKEFWQNCILRFAFASLLSILPSTVTLNNKNSLRKFHQYSKCKKKTKTEKQKLTTQYERDGKAGKGAKQVENIYMQDGVKPAYMAAFVLEQYHRISSARDFTLES